MLSQKKNKPESVTELTVFCMKIATAPAEENGREIDPVILTVYLDGENGARTGRIKRIDIGLGPETGQLGLRLPEIVTVGQHGSSTLLCDTKKRYHLARTRAVCSWYHLVLTINPPNQCGSIALIVAVTGFLRNALL